MSTTTTTFILGASDPEMERIEALLRSAGIHCVYAMVSGRRVHPGNAYEAQAVSAPVEGPVVLVECGGPALDTCRVCHDRASGRADGLGVRDNGQAGGLGPCGDHHAWPIGGVEGPLRIDHHHEGDPGFGKGPGDFLAASSLGQVISWLGRHDRLPSSWARWDLEVGAPPEWGLAPGVVAIGGGGARWEVGLLDGWSAEIPADLVLAAAADHALAAAYAGACPGVSIEALTEWRDASRAAWQRRSVDDVRRDRVRAESLIDRAWELLNDASLPPVVDLRHLGDIPEIGDAASRMGIAVIYRLPARHPANRGDRAKTGILGAGDGSIPGRGPVERFLRELVPAWGLTDTYGDAARGYAGGYEQAAVEWGNCDDCGAPTRVGVGCGQMYQPGSSQAAYGPCPGVGRSTAKVVKTPEGGAQ